MVFGPSARYQIRVLQPAGSPLADDLAGLMRAVATGPGVTIGVRRFPSGRYRYHELVYLDLTQKGH